MDKPSVSVIFLSFLSSDTLHERLLSVISLKMMLFSYGLYVDIVTVSLCLIINGIESSRALSMIQILINSIGESSISKRTKVKDRQLVGVTTPVNNNT
jgi:hypothetical protein